MFYSIKGKNFGKTTFIFNVNFNYEVNLVMKKYKLYITQ